MVELSASEVLSSDDYSLKDRVEAYQQIHDELASLGAEFSNILVGFETEYNGFEVFAKMTDNVIEFIDQVDLSVDEINELYGA